MKPATYEQRAEAIIRTIVSIVGRASMKVDTVKHRQTAEKVKTHARGRNSNPRS